MVKNLNAELTIHSSGGGAAHKGCLCYFCPVFTQRIGKLTSIACVGMQGVRACVELF